MTTSKVLLWSLVALAGNILLALVLWVLYVSFGVAPKLIPFGQNYL